MPSVYAVFPYRADKKIDLHSLIFHRIFQSKQKGCLQIVLADCISTGCFFDKDKYLHQTHFNDLPPKLF